jgi:methionyl-tRNA formyltransferase
LRNVYLGTSDFAATVLAQLLDSPHAPSLVVTRPARPKGRGKKLQNPPVAELANERGIPVFQPESVNDPEAVERISAEKPDAITVCAFGAIVKEPLLSMAPSFNVHPSLLPRWRGAAPVERSIMAGDDETGVTIHRTVEALDAGPVAAQRAFAIEPDDDAGAVYARAAETAAELLRDVLAQDGPRFEPQLEEGATYAEKIRPADRELDPDAPAQELVNRVRALSPHIGARLGDLIVWRAQVGEDGSFEPLEVQPAGARRMAYDAYLRGRR